jgi:hypothetical protein
MTVDSTSEQFPLDGAGASTALAASSAVKNATKCILAGITNNDPAGTAVEVILTNGSNVAIGDPFTIPAAAMVGMLGQWGFPGADRPGPFGAKLASGTGSVLLWYLVVDLSTS